jgi:hypothetical protein
MVHGLLNIQEKKEDICVVCLVSKQHKLDFEDGKA